MKQRESRTKSVRQQGINRNPTTKEIPKPNQKALLNSSQTAIVLRHRRIEQPKLLAVGAGEPTKDKTIAWGRERARQPASLIAVTAQSKEGLSSLLHLLPLTAGTLLGLLLLLVPASVIGPYDGHLLVLRLESPLRHLELLLELLVALGQAPVLLRLGLELLAEILEGALPAIANASLALGVEPVVVFPKDAALIPEDAGLLRALSREMVGGAGFALVSLRDQGGDAELLVHRVHLVPQDAVLLLSDVLSGASFGLMLASQVGGGAKIGLAHLRFQSLDLLPVLATLLNKCLFGGALVLGCGNLLLSVGLLVADVRGRERDHGTSHLRVATSIRIVHGGGRKGVLAGSAREVVVAGGGEADRRDGPAPPLWPSSREDCSAVSSAAFFDASAVFLASKSLSQAVTPKSLDLGFGMSW
ncbi:hypothetical protein PG997_010720 [Apiospora hydei]|uniref:Uncharacterized protein n=1 Tax=Apiospora hydei TaxID=1337664 RepID=A0ABR1VH32_9PEZI